MNALKRRTPLLFLLLSFTLGLALPVFSGCSHADKMKTRQTALKAQAKTYNRMLRWQYYGAASKFVKTDERDAFLQFYEGQRDTLKMTEVNLVSAEVDEEDSLKGTTKVWITYYRYPSASLQKQLLLQEWEFDEEDEAWKIIVPEIKGRDPKLRKTLR